MDTELTVVLGNKIVTKFKADLTEEQIMTVFNISSKKETYIDSEGLLEFHCKERDMMIYSNIKANEAMKPSLTKFQRSFSSRGLY
jgi:hypothetical protein